MEVNQIDNVNKPRHYNRGKFQPIDVIEDWGLDFHLGNALKYIQRAGHKDPSKLQEDLEKAKWYLNRLLSIKEVPYCSTYRRKISLDEVLEDWQLPDNLNKAIFGIYKVSIYAVEYTIFEDDLKTTVLHIDQYLSSL